MCKYIIKIYMVFMYIPSTQPILTGQYCLIFYTACFSVKLFVFLLTYLPDKFFLEQM